MTLHDDIAVQRRRVDLETRKLRQLLMTLIVLRDGTDCRACGTATLLTAKGHSLRRTLDHIIPQSFGGKDDEANLQILCSSCNSKKGAAVSRSLLCPACRKEEL